MIRAGLGLVAPTLGAVLLGLLVLRLSLSLGVQGGGGLLGA